MQKKQIDIVVPCYNEAENITALIEAVNICFENEAMRQYNHRFIFVNDGSSDNSLQILQKLSSEKHM